MVRRKVRFVGTFEGSFEGYIEDDDVIDPPPNDEPLPTENVEWFADYDAAAMTAEWPSQLEAAIGSQGTWQVTGPANVTVPSTTTYLQRPPNNYAAGVHPRGDLLFDHDPQYTTNVDWHHTLRLGTRKTGYMADEPTYLAPDVPYAIEVAYVFGRISNDSGYINCWQAWGKGGDGHNRQMLALFMVGNELMVEVRHGKNDNEDGVWMTPDKYRQPIKDGDVVRFRLEFLLNVEGQGWACGWWQHNEEDLRYIFGHEGDVGTDKFYGGANNLLVNSFGCYSESRQTIHVPRVRYGIGATKPEPFVDRKKRIA